MHAFCAAGLLAVVLSAPSAAQDSTFAFHGARLGDTLILERGRRDCPEKPFSDSLLACVRVDSVGVAIVGTSLEYFRGRLMRVSMSFPSQGFDYITHAFSLVYGEPSRGESAVETMAGGRITNATAVWRVGLDSLIAVRYDRTSRDGSLQIAEHGLFAAWRKMQDDALVSSMRKPET